VITNVTLFYEIKWCW